MDDINKDIHINVDIKCIPLSQIEDPSGHLAIMCEKHTFYNILLKDSNTKMST